MWEKNRKSTGFSIIEVMIFVSLVSMVLIAAVGYTIQLLQAMHYNQNKMLATRDIEDVIEWLDREREIDWQDFQSVARQATTANYCMNAPIGLSQSLINLTITNPISSCGFTRTISGRPFRRILNLQKNTADAVTASLVTATITVSWEEGTQVHQERIQKTYSLWQ